MREAGHFILTLYEKRVAAADLPFFLGLMEHLGGSRHHPSAAPVKEARLATRSAHCGWPAALVTFLRGMWFAGPRRKHCAALGEALGGAPPRQPQILEPEPRHRARRSPAGGRCSAARAERGGRHSARHARDHCGVNWMRP